MEIVVDVRLKIDTIFENATPVSIMNVTKWNIEGMRTESIHKVLDWKLVEIKYSKNKNLQERCDS